MSPKVCRSRRRLKHWETSLCSCRRQRPSFHSTLPMILMEWHGIAYHTIHIPLTSKHFPLLNLKSCFSASLRRERYSTVEKFPNFFIGKKEENCERIKFIFGEISFHNDWLVVVFLKALNEAWKYASNTFLHRPCKNLAQKRILSKFPIRKWLHCSENFLILWSILTL